MDPLTLALAGGTILSSWLGGNAQKKAAERAAQVQAQAARAASEGRAKAIEGAVDPALQGLSEGQDYATQGYDAALGALGPQRWDATNQLYSDMGAGAGGFAAVQDGLRKGFQTDPGYEFRRSEGEKSLARSYNRNGLLRSGNYDQALVGYNSRYASDEYGKYVGRWQDYMGRLYGMAGREADVGSQRAGIYTDRGNALGTYRVNRGQVRANAMTGAADARAEGTYGAGSAQAQGIQNAGNAQAQMWNNIGNSLSYFGGRARPWGSTGGGGQVGAYGLGGGGW